MTNKPNIKKEADEIIKKLPKTKKEREEWDRKVKECQEELERLIKELDKLIDEDDLSSFGTFRHVISHMATIDGYDSSKLRKFFDNFNIIDPEEIEALEKMFHDIKRSRVINSNKKE